MDNESNNGVVELREEVKVYRALYSSVNSEVNNLCKTTKGVIVFVILSILFTILNTLVLLLIIFNKDNDTVVTDNCNAVVLVRTPQSSNEELVLDNTNVNDYVTLPLVESIAVSKDSKGIDLYNPIENEGLFEIAYIFKDTNDNVIFESDYIAPGDKMIFDVSKYFKGNNTSCNCHIVSRYIDSKEAANGAIYNITVSLN